MIETVGGALMMLGLFTRPVAFILAGEMAFAYFIGHFPRGFFPLLNNGTLAIQMCFSCLYLATAGGEGRVLAALFGCFRSRARPQSHCVVFALPGRS